MALLRVLPQWIDVEKPSGKTAKKIFWGAWAQGPLGPYGPHRGP